MPQIYKDYYGILRVQRNASKTEIRKSYLRLAMELHPDKTKGDEDKTAQFKDIEEAFSVLGDETKKSIYDRDYVPGIKRSNNTAATPTPPPDITKTPQEQFVEAAATGDIPTLESLFKLGSVQLDPADPSEALPLVAAIFKWQMGSIQWLLQHGVDINRKFVLGESSSKDYYTYLSLVITFKRKEAFEILKLLMAAPNLNANERDIYGRTALMSAAKRGSIEAVSTILAFKDERTVNLEYTSNDFIVTDNWESGATDMRFYGPTALMYAAAGKHIDICKVLLQYGAQVDTAARCGATALMIAATTGNEKIVDMFIEKGANINACYTQEDLYMYKDPLLISHTRKETNVYSALACAALAKQEHIVAKLLNADTEPTLEILNNAIKMIILHKTARPWALEHPHVDANVIIKKMLKDYRKKHYTYNPISGYTPKRTSLLPTLQDKPIKTSDKKQKRPD